ncbi:MAG TPA: hypothetical protein VFX16_20580 [Pseudonocardiaceae bacterium]|nr:hypothetical protein [Pseudonocardiaceae bacterium]
MTGTFLVCVAVAIGGAVVVGGTALALKAARLGERREKWHDQTTGPAGAMFNALFLAAFALSVVLAWQAYNHATADTADESSALISLYDDVAGLPNGAQLQGEIRDYADTVLNQEWPLLPAGGSTEAADQQLRMMSNQILGVPTDQDSVQATRSETIKELDAVSDARDQRLRDTHTRLPTGLLACLVIAAVVALGHGVLSGLPHTASSLIPLAIEGAMVAGAVCIVFVVRRPYHGALEITPDDIRLAIAHFAART